MSKLSGKLLAFNCFSWPEGKKSDGSHRSAGSYKSVLVLEEGPSLATSSVVEVQIPDDQVKEFDSRSPQWEQLQTVDFFVTHTGKGRAKLLGF